MRNTACIHGGGFRGFPRARARGLPARAAGLAIVAAGLGGCAATGQPAAVEPAPSVVRYSVESGDRLGTIARDFTGDTDVWRTIAELNGIDDPRRLAVGQVLEIPLTLIPEADREARLAASVAPPAEGAPASDDDASTRLATLRPGQRADANGAATPPDPRPTGESPTDASALRVASAPVVVSPVRSREAFELSPLDDPQADDAGDAGARFIKVSGSYTPKGIYERPAAQSRVMMRVTPGTVLRLERTVSGWYQVGTAGGPGYLRDTDAQLVQPERTVVGAGG